MNEEEHRREPTNEERARMRELVEEHLGMVLPSGHSIPIEVAGQRIGLGQCWIYFPEYAGPPPNDTCGKPVVASAERPFAELQVAARIENRGWRAGWRQPSGEFISTWEPHRAPVEFSRSARALLRRIEKRAGREAACSWDVFAWRRKPKFVVVQRDSDAVGVLSELQTAWLDAALAEGVPSSAFEIWRWFGGSLQDRVLRLTMYSYDKLDAWIDLRDGRLIESQPGKRGILDHYRSWGARTEADLMWLTFVRNSDGITWCGIEERAA